MKILWQIVKLAPKNVLLYPFYAILSWTMTLLTWALSPVLSAWSVIADINVLPYPFNLFHTHDNTLDGGQKALGWEKGVTGFKLWWQRVKWLCRNPGYGFNAYIIGFKAEGSKIIWSVSIGDRKFDKGGSVIYAVVMEDAKGDRYWSYRRDYDLPGKFFCKQWFGWHYYPYDKIHHQLKSLPFSVKRPK